ncbi:protein ILRUN isoform X3 [Marmota monax]|uniref:protein ILRUN isoform X3 n=1 Tax=Marmota monax TaxID=9995 RepID=UPI001EAFFAD6|nr:protein ILRUN isoform X3 [Marmota monax]
MEGMDVDLDPELMQKFSCLGTTDKDVLISEFQRLLGFQLNPAGCAFFLDMTNWNLQAAIGAYYDFESPNISVPSMSFVKDVTIGEGESIPPDTQFIKTWRIQNSGAEAWPPGVCLKYVGGDQFGHVNMVMVRSLEPQEIADVSVQMCSPSRAGMYQGQWRMCTATGLYYGDVIWVILSVEVGGLLGVTQQLSSFETEFNTQPHRKPPQFLGLQTGHHHAQLNISCAIYANLQKSQTHLVPAISGAPRALPLRPVLNGCQQEEKLTKDRRPDFGGEGKGFLWIANHIARIPALISHPGRRGRSKTELVLSKLSMHV